MSDILPKTQWTRQNIRAQWALVSAAIEEAKSLGERDEVEHYEELEQEMLQFMTPAQRSWCMDDFDEIPSVFEKVMAQVKEEEAQ